MRSIFVPVASAFLVGAALYGTPASLDDAEYQYSDFLDSLYEQTMPKAAPPREEDMVVRKAFWNDDRRVLMVDTRMTHGKGHLVVLEGYPSAGSVHEFRISSEMGAEFELPIDDRHAVPCRVVVKAGQLSNVVSVANAPGVCS